jgi:uncharacterized protein (TIGR00645 family)
MRKFEHGLEAMIFRSRWLLAPFFVGLIVAIVALLVKFGKGLVGLIPLVLDGDAEGGKVIIEILSLVDAALIASLLLIIIFSGYENFVSKIAVGEHEDRPAWMGKVGFSDLKLKLIGAIVAISAVELLKAFIDSTSSTNINDKKLAWMVGIHFTFVLSGVMFALTDRIADRKGGGH